MVWTVAVTGATGYVGQFVVPQLLASGHRVRAMQRPDTALPDVAWRSDVEWIDGGLDDDRGDTALVHGADAFIHLAYDHVAGRYRGGEGEDVVGFYRRNLGGTRRLIAASRTADVPRFAFLSSRAVYGERLWDRRLDELHPTRPDSHYGAVKLAIEAELAAHAAVDGWHATSLRCTGVYGLVEPVVRSKWAAIVGDLLAGRQNGERRGGTEVHGADVALALDLMLKRDEAQGQAYVCSDVFVANRAVARLAAPDRADLWPAAASPPSGVLMADRLRKLGWQPRGWHGVAATVGELVDRLI